MVVQYEDLTNEQKEIYDMIIEDCKNSVNKLLTKNEKETVDAYIVEIKLEDPIL